MVEGVCSALRKFTTTDGQIFQQDPSGGIESSLEGLVRTKVSERIPDLNIEELLGRIKVLVAEHLTLMSGKIPTGLELMVAKAGVVSLSFFHGLDRFEIGNGEFLASSRFEFQGSDNCCAFKIARMETLARRELKVQMSLRRIFLSEKDIQGNSKFILNMVDRVASNLLGASSELWVKLRKASGSLKVITFTPIYCLTLPESIRQLKQSERTNIENASEGPFLGSKVSIQTDAKNHCVLDVVFEVPDVVLSTSPTLFPFNLNEDWWDNEATKFNTHEQRYSSYCSFVFAYLTWAFKKIFCSAVEKAPTYNYVVSQRMQFAGKANGKALPTEEIDKLLEYVEKKTSFSWKEKKEELVSAILNKLEDGLTFSIEYSESKCSLQVMGALGNTVYFRELKK